MMGIHVKNLTKRFGRFTAVDDVSFEVPQGRLAALLGPSGGGKSTILRLIAGLETADAGEVRLDNEQVDHLHARQRQVGFVFQHYALFRHMTVHQNIAFGLKVRKAPRPVQEERVAQLLELIGLKGLEHRYPDQLSGGQRQRVALARALATQPRLLLLDEPFGSVDAKVREELGRWLRRMHDELNVTSIFVTHDQEEAFSLADQVMIINEGRLEQDGTPLDILDSPATEFVARFVGEVNVIDTVMEGGQAVVGALRLAVHPPMPDNARVRLVIRSYDFRFYRDDQGPAVVERMLSLGDRVKVDAVIDGYGRIMAQFPRRSSFVQTLEPGCRITLDATYVRAFPLPKD